MTDFNLIKAGALHHANGGYVVLDARRVLLQPFAWEIRIESLVQTLSLISTVTLEPEPIPPNVKVVLVGDRLLYYLLYALDPDFGELFKVPVDFADDVGRTPDTTRQFARLLATIAARDRLRPLARDAVARVIERASRLVDDAAKLSIHGRTIGDLLREADYFARGNGHESINQHNQVQAIGGVNEKVEGFFHVCRERGLTGDQGVIIPSTNIEHLMLRDDVVEAVAKGEFRIYAVETVDQGIEILTGHGRASVDLTVDFRMARSISWSRRGSPAWPRWSAGLAPAMTAGGLMTEAQDHGSRSGFAVRRILAAFGPATMTAGVLEGAVDLAGRLGAELEALFVEDVTLLQWTELPFIRQVSLHGLTAIPLSQRDLELQFRALATEAQSRLSAIAVPRQLRWSFRTARGQVSGEVIAAAAHADLLVLGSSIRPVAREALLEPSVRSLIGAVKAPVLLLRSAPPSGGPVHVVLEADGKGKKLLEAAIAMAGGDADDSIVTAWTPRAALEDQPDEEIARAASRIRVRRFSGSEGIEILLGAVATETLVLSATSSLLALNSCGSISQGGAALFCCCLQPLHRGARVDSDQSASERRGASWISWGGESQTGEAT